MIRQPHALSREVIVAEAVQELVSELRLVDAADYIAFIRLEHYACISDIVDSAAELYYLPQTFRRGHGGEAHVSWSGPPRIDFDLELRAFGVTVYFTLSLAAETASVEVNYVAFEKPDSDPDRNTALLAEAIEASRIRRTEPVL